MTEQTLPKKSINLALQGGGAHGSYTWGVLDRLLDEPTIEIDGISGTSAGAMNAAVMLCGYLKNGRQGAKDHLRGFWERVAELGQFSPFQQNYLERLLYGWNLDSSATYQWFDAISRMFSPYDLNPLNINPLRLVLNEFIDEDVLKSNHSMHLFIAATHVASGQARVFHCHEVNTEVLLASACLPFMFQAAEIDGEHYWDGGYMGNPVIWPLIYNTKSEDVMLVQINPLHRNEVPRHAYQIINRLNEISFNSSLIAEMRAIDFVKKLLHEKRLDPKKYKDVKMHLIYSPDEILGLDASSKLNTSWDFFRFLHQQGYETTDAWLKKNYHHLGVRSTLDIHDKFLYTPWRKSPPHEDAKAVVMPAVKGKSRKQQ